MEITEQHPSSLKGRQDKHSEPVKLQERKDIVIRLVSREDAKQLFRLVRNNYERLTAYFPLSVSAMRRFSLAKAFVKHKVQEAAHKKSFYYVIETDANEIIGNIAIKSIDKRIPKSELSYFIDKNYEGKGIISFALHHIIEHAFSNLKIEKLFLKIAPENMASKHLAMKFGFIKEGYLRKEHRTTSGALIDVEYYGLTRPDWSSQKETTSAQD